MKFKTILKKVLPEQIIVFYHWTLSLLAALYYRFPSKDLYVIGITGTKGKTTTVEILNKILEEAGFKTAIASTLRFKLGDESNRNMMKMTMPGRFFLQKFLQEAKERNCDYVLVEMTSEGAKLFRHNYIYLDALIFTGITPEHIESHGSYENYLKAKLSIAKSLEKSPKKDKVIVVNEDSEDADKFLSITVSNKLKFNQTSGKPLTISEYGIEFSFAGEVIKSRLVGSFNLYNLLGAATLAKFIGINSKIIKKAIENFDLVPGRMEYIKPLDPKIASRQNFLTIVDYAHTPESLEKVYKTYPDKKKICVLGGTGGGRDKWKREVMGSIADSHCGHIILTDEDPYDEDPKQIIDQIKLGIKNHNPEIIIDRRLAIRRAIDLADKGDVIFVTGKGTDPYIMGANGNKIPWSDADITREELTEKLK